MTWIEVPFEVQKNHEGFRVDSYLAQRLHRYSRAEVQRFIAQGRVFLREKPVKSSARLAAGDRVLIRYPKRDEPPCAYACLPVLFEDQNLLAVNKPAGVLSHPTDKIVENSVTTILKRQFPDLKLHLLHRLDRETSGALLLAKDPRTARAMTNLFAARQAQKEYWAICRGRPAWKTTTVDAPLGREGLEIKVRQKVGHGQNAVTDFELLAANEGASLISAAPKTGRLHQIRAHLAYLGHPVLGDKLYTGEGQAYMKAVRQELESSDLEALGAARQMLHARRLRLSGLDIIAPASNDFVNCLSRRGLEMP